MMGVLHRTAYKSASANSSTQAKVINVKGMETFSIDSNSWKEEIDNLTKFHPQNIGFFDLKSDEDDLKRDNKVLKPVFNTPNNKMKTIGRGRKKPDEDGEESFIGRRIMETIGAAHRSESIFNHKYSIKTYSNDLALKEEEKKCLDEDDDDQHLGEENVKSATSYFPAFPYWKLIM